MFVIDYVFYLIAMLMVVGIVVLGVTLVSYYGVISLIGFVFLCCVFISMIGRTFIALVTYIIYLGGLIVVFGYCISVEKGVDDVFKMFISKLFTYLFACVGLIIYLWVVWFFGFGD